LWFISTSNRLVTLEQGVKASWSQVENTYQRRMDLISNLVETVKGVAGFEQKTFTDVAEARAKAGQIQLSGDVLDDPQKFEQFQNAQAQLSAGLGRLLATAEAYPQLKANESFQSLQAQLEGTENRIAVERRRFNEMVQQFNVAILRFPTSLVASLKGVKEKPYFKADPGASEAPKVKF
jgi:LemA protein